MNGTPEEEPTPEPASQAAAPDAGGGSTRSPTTEPDDDGKELQESANRATVIGLRLNWYMLLLTVASVIIALIGLYVGQSGSNEPPSAVQCVQEGNNNQCTVRVRGWVDAMSRDSMTESEFIDRIRSQSTNKPTGDGPYPFVVVDSGDEGLFARSTNELNGDRLGYTQEHGVVFADCVATSSFAPVVRRERDVGATWLRIRWKTNQTSNQAMQSDPSDRYLAWMYRGYLEPLGHNGEIPRCAES